MLKKFRQLRQAIRNAVKFSDAIPELWSTVRNDALRIRNLEFCIDMMIGAPEFSIDNNWAFNGQEGRRDIVRSILKSCPFDAVIETGTFMGESTGFLANSTNMPVFTCELNDRFFALSKKRLARFTSITGYHGDSRSFLRFIDK